MVWPESNSSAAGTRIIQLIKEFHEQGYRVTFASSAMVSEFTSDLKSLNVICHPIELNNASFDIFIKEFQPSIVVFDRFISEEQYGWRVTEHCPDAIKILDTEDLHCLRLARQQAFKDNVEIDKSYLFGDIAKREIASIYRCDVSLIISKYELGLLLNEFKVPADLLFYLPFLLDKIEDNQINELPLFENRNHFISIGNFLHEPNWNAVLYLKEKIWPLIKYKLPDAELHIYGAYPTQKVFQLHNIKQGFIIKGRAEKAHEVMQKTKVCLAPLQFGAGLKGKLIDAMQCGTPNVTTTIGSEGMNELGKWSGFLGDDADNIADRAIELYTNKELWLLSQSQGFDIINQVFNKDIYVNAFNDKINFLINHIDEHRLNNFTGSMLNHHTMQSTKYLSRWIELKNTKAEN